jgi:hypothetical protein
MGKGKNGLRQDNPETNVDKINSIPLEELKTKIACILPSMALIAGHG